jgi:hypothetical protein
LEKKKFEEKIQLSEEEEYQNEYNKLLKNNQEIESIILYKENKIEDIKVMKISQKGGESKKNRECTKKRCF